MRVQRLQELIADRSAAPPPGLYENVCRRCSKPIAVAGSKDY